MKKMMKFIYPILVSLFLTASILLLRPVTKASHTPHSNTGHTVEGLVARFTFETGSHDELRNFAPTKLHGVTIDNGALQVDRGTWAQAPYIGPPLQEQTLVSFIRLKDLGIKGGSPVTFTTNNSSYFNGLALGEIPIKFRATNINWVAISEFKDRSKDLRPPFKETYTHQLLKMAISYKKVNGQCQVSIYRNGEQIAQYTKGRIGTLAPQNSQVLFGMREFHDKTSTYPPTSDVWLKADIEEVQIYNRALSQAEIQLLDYAK